MEVGDVTINPGNGGHPPSMKKVILIGGNIFYMPEIGNIKTLVPAEDLPSVMRKMTYAQTEYACNHCAEQSCEPVEGREYTIHDSPEFEIDLRGKFHWTKLNEHGKIKETTVVNLLV